MIGRYIDGTSWPFHVLAAWLFIMVIYWTTAIPEWLVFGP